MNNSHVFLTRHGARVDTEDQQWLRKCSHNRSDDPHLSSAGRKGALELAAEIKRQVDGCTVAHIVSSPYVRCVETAHIVAEVIGVDVKIEPGIAEVKSSRTPGFLDVVELKRQYPLIDTTYTPIMASGDLSREYSDGACAKRSSKYSKTSERTAGRYNTIRRTWCIMLRSCRSFWSAGVRRIHHFDTFCTI
eukprot:g9937.t1 g9937   contig4:911711-912283(-)